MAFTYGNPNTTDSSFQFVTDNFEQIKEQSLRVKKAEIVWPNAIEMSNVDMSVNAGAHTVAKKVMDEHGMAAWHTGDGQDIPTVSLSTGKISIPMQCYAVAGHVSREDVRTVQFGHAGLNYVTEIGMSMRSASERFLERTFFYGDDALGFNSFINYPNVPVIGATGNWDTLTAEQVYENIEDMCTAIINGTNDVFQPDTLALPIKQYLLITSLRLDTANSSNETVYQAALRMLRDMTGNDNFKIIKIRHLSGAGAGDVDRAKMYKRLGDDNQYMPMPMGFEMLSPQERGLGTDLFAEGKVGSYWELNPLSGVYMDGI